MQEDLERQLHLERARLEAVLRQMPSGVLIVEAPSGKVVLANEQLARISGRSTRLGEALEGYRDWQTFHPDGRLYQVDEWPLVRSMEKGETVIDEEMAFIRDGNRAVMRASSAPIRDPNGRIIAAVVTIQDITERKQAEEALRTSEERYRLLFERNLAGVCRSTIDGWLLDCNDSFARILGYADRAEILGQQAHDLYFSPADREAFLAALRRTASLTGFEIRYRRKDGSPVWALENATLQTVDDDAFIDATLVDITQRKQAEEAAQLSAARYRSLIENLSQGIALKDQELRYAVVNSPFCNGLARDEAAIIGMTDFDLYPRPQAEKYFADDRRVLAEGQRVETEQEMRVGDKPRTVRVVKTAVRDDDGRVVGVLGIFWDVTDQQALEAQLRQAQKMEAVGLLAGGVAHDFNNLLSVIIGNIALSLGGMPDDHPNRELLLTAERAGVQAAELTNSLLGFSRQTILRPVPTHLQASVEETVRILRRTIDPRIEVVTRLSPNLWLVEADPVQMNQVLLNLCINARDAMPEGGRLTLEAENLLVDSDYSERHVEVAARRIRPAADQRHGPRHSAGNPRPHLRAVLHHQGNGQGDRLGTGDGFRHRQAAPRLDRVLQRDGQGNAL